MANRQWTGATDGVVSTNGNYTGGAAPTAGDSVFADIAPTNAMASGTFPALVTFQVTEAYGANNIGSAASPVTFGTVTTMRIAGSGTGYYMTTGAVTTANFEMPNGSTAIISGGTFTTTNITGCALEGGASAVFTNINSIGATGNVATNATSITSLTGSGKWTVTSRDITTANVDPGMRLTIKGSAALGTAGTVNIVGGGIFNHQSMGTVTAANIRTGGTYTVAGNSGSSGVATLTTANVWKGGTLVEAVSGFTLTITNRNYIGGQSAGGLTFPTP